MSDKEFQIYIQVADADGGPIVPQSASDKISKISSDNLKQVAELIKTSWSGLLDDLKSMPQPPSEVGIEFGIDLGAEGGIPFISKGSIGANFKVSVTWKKE